MNEEPILGTLYTNSDLVEFFELCKHITEKFYDPDDDLYQWFHDDNNIARAVADTKIEEDNK